MMSVLQRLFRWENTQAALYALGYIGLNALSFRLSVRGYKGPSIFKSSLLLSLQESLNGNNNKGDSEETINVSLPARRKYWAARDGEHSYFEQVEGPEAIAWVKQQNAKTLQELGDPTQLSVYKDLLAILESKDRIPDVQKIGPYLYNYWDDDQSPRGILRRTTEEEFRKANPTWETLIDFDALGKEEGESWVYMGYDAYKPDDLSTPPRRILLSISRGGADATVVREYDLIDQCFIPAPDGFVLHEAKNFISWLTADSVLVGTDFKDGASMTTSGYPRTCRVWKRGTDLFTDTVEDCACSEADIYINSFVTRHAGHKYHLRHRALTFYTSEESILMPDGWKNIPKQDGAKFSMFQDQALIELRADWCTESAAGDERTFVAGSLLAVYIEELMEYGSAANFTCLFTPTDTTSLHYSSPTQNYLALVILEHVKTKVVLWKYSNATRRWAFEGQEASAAIRGIGLSAFDCDASDACWMRTSSFVTPSSLSLVSLAEGIPALGNPKVIKALPQQFNSNGVVEKQGMAISADGTSIPYFLVCREDVLSAGHAPTLLYGYGGFEVSIAPSYAALTGKAWIENGGCYVIANIRGGGEYGPRWHKAALKQNRYLCYDDFIAVAEDIISKGITTSKKLGIRGGSNGGLLMGNMITRRPDLWAAVVCQVPLLDMKIYNRLLAGASWAAEYGDPDTSDWKFLQCISPYHNIDPVSVSAYPSILMLTSTKDDRVHPYHARSFVKRLLDVKEMEERRLGVVGDRSKVKYYENIEGGHGGAADLKQEAFQNALFYKFLEQKLSNTCRLAN